MRDYRQFYIGGRWVDPMAPKDLGAPNWLATELFIAAASTMRRRTLNAPFGGFKMSGNGREWGELALGEFLELKAAVGYKQAV